MTVLRFPARPSHSSPSSRNPLTQVSANHPSLGLIWANDQAESSILDLFPVHSSEDRLEVSAGDGQLISCNDCTMANTSACGDCVVSLLAEGPSRTRSVSLDADEAEMIDLFSRAGIVPKVRHSCERAPGRAANW